MKAETPQPFHPGVTEDMPAAALACERSPGYPLYTTAPMRQDVNARIPASMPSESFHTPNSP